MEKKAAAEQLLTQANTYITAIDNLITAAEGDEGGNNDDSETCQDTDGNALDTYNEGC